MDGGWSWLPIASKGFARSWRVVVIQGILLGAGGGGGVVEVREDGWSWGLRALAAADEEEYCEAD